jgi:hypothetical protein
MSALKGRRLYRESPSDALRFDELLVTPAPTSSQVASNASPSPAILLSVNNSPRKATTGKTMIMKFKRKIDALVLIEPTARLRMK